MIKQKTKKLLIVLGVLALMGCQPVPKVEVKQRKVPAFASPEQEKKVNSILAEMTLEEKLAQIEGIRPSDVIVDGKFSPEKAAELIPYGIGHFCQFSSGLTMNPEQLRDFVRQVQNWLMKNTRLGIPAIFHEEAITGFATQGATTFPQQIGMGCTWNPELVKECATTTRKNMRAAGATFALSPMLDISRSAYWNRIEESYGEDAYLTSRMGVAFIEGLQGNDFRTGVAATTKHFAGYGTQNDNPKELYEEYIMPHEAAMKIAGSKSVMPSYGKYKGIAVAASHEMLTDILRSHLGFDGLVVSDYGAVNLIYKGHKQAQSSKEAAVKALKAGIDVELARPIAFPLLAEALKEGTVSRDEVDAAVRRSLIMKAKLGLLDEQPQIGQDGALDFDPPAYRELAYRAATQSIVLLKNDGILPLKKEVKKIALLGPNSDTYYCLLGDYTYQSMISFWYSTEFDPNNPKLVTLKEGLENRLGNSVELLQERGCDWSAPLESVIDKNGLGDDRLSKLKLMTIKGLPQPNMKRALDFARESDVIIVAVGENLYLCGEGRQRKGIRLPGEQEAFVERLLDTGKPVILIVFGGRQQVLHRLKDRCAAIIQAWFPGEEGGNALADILTGAVNPSGKLCVSYPASEAKQELNYKNAYSEVKVDYPFGFGLSYTTFEYTDLEVPNRVSIDDERFTVKVSVRNTGTRDGDEIVQLYISPQNPDSGLKPIQLKGFKRVSLRAGQMKRLSFSVSPQQLAQFEQGRWFVKSGEFTIKVGASCTDIRQSADIHIEGEPLILKNGRELFFASVKEH